MEIGKIDIFLKVYMMLSHISILWEGHLEQLYHIFAYLNKYHNFDLLIDPVDQVIYHA